MKNLSKSEQRILTLSLILQKGLGKKIIKQLFEHYGSMEAIFLPSNIPSYSEVLKLKIAQALDHKAALELEAILVKRNIKYLCFWEEDFPNNFKTMSDPPIIIFYVGEYSKEKLDKSVSIVGTRKISDYGIKTTEKLTQELISEGFSIISGLAFGVDYNAHKMVVKAGGYTAAILAGSPDECLPAGNHLMYNQILNTGGVIISEYYPGVKIVPGMFAERNRLIAGISKATIVIEAPEKSGSLITAELALDYNKEVYAVPGSLFNKNSEGTNKLIKDNKAKLLTSTQDILIDLGYSKFVQKSLDAKFEQNLTNSENAVYSLLENNALDENEISLQIGLTISEVISICAVLELKSLIKKNIYNKYEVS